jgi:hypothetical protein
MSTEQTSTPEQDPQATGQRQVTVAVPEDRVEQFQAFYERFLAHSERGHRHGGGRSGPQGRGGRGSNRRRHIRKAMFHLAMAEHDSGERHGRCAHRRAQDDQASTTVPTATL